MLSSQKTMDAELSLVAFALSGCIAMVMALTVK